MNPAKRSRRTSPQLLCWSIAISLCVWLWTCSVVVYVLSDPHRWAMTRYVISLFHQTQLIIPLAIPPPSTTSVLSLRVDVDQAPLLAQDAAPSTVLSSMALHADSPVRLVGMLSVQVMALDAAGCVIASASTRYRASGESQIQLPLALIPTATPACPARSAPATEIVDETTHSADRN